MIKDFSLRNMSSRGNQEKFYKDGYLYKIDTFGNESISEVLVSTLGLFIKDISMVDYSLVEVNGKPGCVCRSYLNEGESDISVLQFMKKYYADSELNSVLGKGSRVAKDFTVKFVEDTVGIEFEEYLGKMIYLDAIALNEDRHYNNIVLIHSDKGYRGTPYFDFGSGLLSDTHLYKKGMNIDVAMNLAMSKPFSKSFEEQVSLFNIDPLEIDINGFLNYLSMVESDLGTSVPFKQEEYFIAKKVLLKSLKKWEGTIWKKL